MGARKLDQGSLERLYPIGDVAAQTASYGIAMTLVGFIRITILAGVTLMVAGLGLRSAAGDASYLLRKPALLARSLLAMHVVLPLVVLGLISVFALRPSVKVALFALAVSPLPPFLPARQLGLGGCSAYVHALFLTTSLFAILFVPIATAALAERIAGARPISAETVFGIVTVTALMPIGLGMLVRRLHPKLAASIHETIERLGAAFLFLALALMLLTQWRAMYSLLGDGTLLSIIVYTAIGLVTGHLLGGSEPGARSTLALATASRHPGVALAVATASFPDQQYAVAAILLAALTGLLSTLPYVARRRRVVAPEAQD